MPWLFEILIARTVSSPGKGAIFAARDRATQYSVTWMFITHVAEYWIPARGAQSARLGGDDG